MRILYLSCHSILEEAELSIFHELGHEIFSLSGAYQNPESPGDPKRPPIPGMKFNQELNDIALQCSKDNIHPKLLEWADIVITMHNLEWLKNNWLKIRENKVIPIWRSIGQSVEMWEKMVDFLRPEGLKIVRYSPQETQIPYYAGSDALIRFGVSAKEYKDWTGGVNKIHLYGQHIKGRGRFLNFDYLNQVTEGLPRVMYGPGNEDCEWSGGMLDFNQLKNSYRTADVAVYSGTVPASYTLSFIEMLMTGTPMVCFGRDLQGTPSVFAGQDTYEIPKIIKNGQNGFVSDNLAEVRKYLEMLLSDRGLRERISMGARKTGIELFSRQKTMDGWGKFLNNL